MFYPGEVEAAANAMKERRYQLLSRPLARIYEELAVATLTAAAEARAKYFDGIILETLVAIPRKLGSPDMIRNGVEAGKTIEFDRAIRIMDKWSDPDHIRLHAGEMTNQEMRSVLAVVRAIRAEIMRD